MQRYTGQRRQAYSLVPQLRLEKTSACCGHQTAMVQNATKCSLSCSMIPLSSDGCLSHTLCSVWLFDLFSGSFPFVDGDSTSRHGVRTHAHPCSTHMRAAVISSNAFFCCRSSNCVCVCQTPTEKNTSSQTCNIFTFAHFPRCSHT